MAPSDFDWYVNSAKWLRENFKDMLRYGTHLCVGEACVPACVNFVWLFLVRRKSLEDSNWRQGTSLLMDGLSVFYDYGCS